MEAASNSYVTIFLTPMTFRLIELPLWLQLWAPIRMEKLNGDLSVITTTASRLADRYTFRDLAKVVRQQRNLPAPSFSFRKRAVLTVAIRFWDLQLCPPQRWSKAFAPSISA